MRKRKLFIREISGKKSPSIIIVKIRYNSDTKSVSQTKSVIYNNNNLNHKNLYKVVLFANEQRSPFDLFPVLIIQLERVVIVII